MQRLNRSFAERGLAHDESPIVILDRAGHDLRRAGASRTDQHDHRDRAIQQRLPFGEILPILPGGPPLRGDNKLSLLQEKIGYGAGFREQAPGVGSEIEDESLHACILQALDRPREFVRGTVGLSVSKSAQANVSYGLGDCFGQGDALYLDDIPDDGEVYKCFLAFAFDGDGDGGARHASKDGYHGL